MQRGWILVAACVAALATACGDESNSTEGTGASGNTGGTGPGGNGGNGGTGGSGGTGAAGGGGSGAGGGTGGGPDCSNLPAGPIAPTLFSGALNGSEDIAFDGLGHIAGKLGGNMVLLDADGTTTTNLAALAGTTYGVRYMQNGNLLAARPGLDSVAQITPAGMVTSYVDFGVNDGPNGVFVDFNDNVWVTLFGGNEVVRIDSQLNPTTIAIGADASQANGVVLHPTLPILYYTEYSAANIWSVDVSGSTFTPQLLSNVPGGAALDGLVMDACNNIYVVDNAGNDLYRLLLDAAGAAMGTPELLSSLQSSVANAQFGSGPGFNATSLYVAGGAGDVYEVDVGVTGAAVPTAP